VHFKHYPSAYDFDTDGSGRTVDFRVKISEFFFKKPGYNPFAQPDMDQGEFGVGKRKRDKRKKETSPTVQRIARSLDPGELHRSALEKTL
jgi:hypothetical protein